MRYLKKFLLVGFITSVLILSFSVSASAASLDFNLSSFPVHNVPKDSGHAFVNGFIEDEASNIYYFEICYYGIGGGSTRCGTYMFPCWGVVDNTDSSAVIPVHNYYFAPLMGCKNDNYSMDTMVYLYDVNGDVVNGLNTTANYGATTLSLSQTYPDFKIGKCNVHPGVWSYDRNKDVLNLKDSSSFIILTDNSYNLEYFTADNPNFALATIVNSNNTIPIISTSFNVNTSSIDKNISINGEPLYSSGGSDDPDVPSLPSFIIGTGTGSDGTTTYNYTYEFDLGLNDSPVPDSWDPDNYPDKEAELLDDLPGIQDSDIDSINSHLSSNSLNSNAVQWWYGRFSDVTSNTKFRSVMLTMLSLSVIAFVLNKRGVL